MDVLEIAKGLGKAIQAEECYTAVMVAKQNNDEDDALQKAIGEFNLVKMNLGKEMARPEAEQDAEKVQELNKKMRALYDNITGNENMKAYERARNEMDGLMNKVVKILSLAANGSDMDGVDLDGEISSCSGSCSSCSGCH